MKKILFLSVIALLFVSVNVSASKSPAPAPKIEAQNQSTVLKGMIFDNQTKETLAGAVVTANGQKVYSDLDGNFSFNNLCDGKCQLKISLISYEDKVMEVDLQNTKTVEVKLQQR